MWSTLKQRQTELQPVQLPSTLSPTTPPDRHRCCKQYLSYLRRVNAYAKNTRKAFWIRVVECCHRQGSGYLTREQRYRITASSNHCAALFSSPPSRKFSRSHRNPSSCLGTIGRKVLVCSSWYHTSWLGAKCSS